MIIYFHSVVILSVILSSVFLLRWKRGIAVHFPMIFLLMPIINIGYLKVATASDINEALIANGIEYLDGCFLELFFFLYIMNFCKLRVPKALTAMLLAAGSTVFFFAINDPTLHLLYTKAELASLDGVSYIIKEYGPVHTAYYIMIGFYLAANLAAIIYSFTRRNVSKINSLLLLVIYLVIIIAFLVGKVFHPAFELLPLSYTFSQVIFLVVMSKINLYDISGSATADIAERGRIGFAAFDSRMRYLGSTEPAEFCLPELKTLYIDKTLTRENNNFRKIYDCIRALDTQLTTPSFYVTRDDVTYKVSAEYLYSGTKIKGYRLMTEDNTREAQMLEALRLRERQKEMESEMLRLEKSASEAANKAKSTFLAQMSHEIRTPINAVLGMNEMILRESREPAVLEYAANIAASGRTLLSLINGILDFSKIEDGKMEILPVQYETAEMISDTVSGIFHRARDKELEFTVDADTSLPRVLKGDDMRISQVISNLLTNAVKYTESGFVKLTVKLQGIHDGAADIFVEVSDSGIGIKQEDISALFEPFKRIDENRSRSIEGTGLGISIVTRLLEMMGSRLEVKSVYGKGSQFSFSLSQEIIDPAPMGSYTEYAHNTAVHRNELYAPEAKVLIVDDNSLNLNVAVKLTGLFGIKADTAASGRAALDMITKQTYDVILLDHMMPEMDGIQVLDEIKSRGLADGRTKIIALTANAIAGAEEMYLSHGFDGYLTKPILVDALEDMLFKSLPDSKCGSSKTEPGQEENEAKEAALPPEDGNTAPAGDEDTLAPEEVERIHRLCPQLDTELGMSYCMNSKEFWLDTLSAFIEADKSDELCAAFDSGSIKTYRITVHSIKSSSKTIGAAALSEKARLLEEAARDSDTEYIRREHSAFAAEYRSLIDGVKRVTEL